jgi:hypothetical protein
MGPNLPSKEQAEQLAKINGGITPDQLQRMYPPALVEGPVAASPMETPKVEAGAAQVAPANSPNPNALPETSPLMPPAVAENVGMYSPQPTPAPPPPQAPSDIQTANLKPEDKVSAQNVSLESDKPIIYEDPMARQKAMMEALMPDEKGIRMQQKAARDAAVSGAAKAAEASALIERTALEDQKRIEAQQFAENERQKKLDSEMAKVDGELAKLSEMKIDPKRFWNNLSTGDKVMAGIGLFLGAFGSGGNKAVPVIENAINQDIAAQKGNIAKQADVVGTQKGIYNDMLAKFKDERLAENATRLAYLDNAQLRVKQIAEKYSAPELKAKADLLIGELEQKKLDTRKAFQIEVMKTLPSLMNPGNPQAMKQEDRERFVPGFGIALTKEDATEMKKYVGEANATKSNVQRLVEIANTPGAKTDMKLRNEAGLIANMLQGNLKSQVLGPGAVTDAERELMKKIIADPTAIFSLDETNKTLLSTLLQTIDRNIAGKAKAYGLTTETQRIGFTPLARK